jgi:hypothetical protein
MSDRRPSPLGQHGPWRDLLGLLQPGPGRTRRLGAALQALGPRQHHRPICERQIPHHDPAAAMADRSHTAGLAPGPILGGLHRESPLAARLVEHLGGHDEPVEPKHADTPLPSRSIRGLLLM